MDLCAFVFMCDGLCVLVCCVLCVCVCEFYVFVGCVVCVVCMFMLCLCVYIVCCTYVWCMYVCVWVLCVFVCTEFSCVLEGYVCCVLLVCVLFSGKALLSHCLYQKLQPEPLCVIFSWTLMTVHLMCRYELIRTSRLSPPYLREL